MESFFDKIEKTETLIKDLGLSSRVVRLAWGRAVRRSSNMIVRAASKELARKEVLRLRDIAKRIKIFPKKDGDVDISMIVFGIPAIFFGAEQDLKGVKIRGGRRFDRAFIARNPQVNNYRNVFSRRYLRRPGRPPRLPVVVEKVELRQAAEQAFLKKEEKFFNVLADTFYKSIEGFALAPKKYRI